ncbi:hypothetical protein GCM10009605_36740 [Nocardiopsis composta]
MDTAVGSVFPARNGVGRDGGGAVRVRGAERPASGSAASPSRCSSHERPGLLSGHAPNRPHAQMGHDMATSKTGKTGSAGLSAEERAAMKERAAEVRAEARRAKGAAKAEADRNDLLAKIEEMPEPDRALARRVHEIVTAAAPRLAPKTWYGMPAYALDGKILCFFQSAAKFKSRYATFGFNDTAALDDGSFWPTSFALTAIGPAEEKAIADLVARAVR